MKIIIQVHSLSWGGAERVAVCWANGLQALGHDVTVLTDLEGEQSYTLDPRIKVIQRDFYHKKRDSFFEKVKFVGLSPFYAFRQLYKIFKKDSPDVFINVLYIRQFTLLLSRFLAGKKTPVIQTDHNAYERPEGSGFGFKQWRNKFIDNRLFDLVTVLTQRDKEILKKKGFKNVEVLYNPLFLKPVEEIPPKENLILSAGRMNAWHVKGFDVLIKAWNKIASANPEWKLRLIGAYDKKSIEMLRDLAKPSLQQVEFAEFSRNMQAEYERASVFVLSSRYEGWGLVLVEAMSQGCACVACDFRGRQAEIIEEGINGLICQPDKEDELADKLQSLISNEEMRLQIQVNSPESVSRFEEEKVAADLEKLLKDVVSHKSKV